MVDDKNKVIYRHYGMKHFYKDNFREIQNEDIFTKPAGGLWASRLNLDLNSTSWKDFCIGDEFRLESLNTYFDFILKDSARVLTIKSIDEIIELPRYENKLYNNFVKHFNSLNDICYLDFEKLKEDYDAIELFISEDYRLRHVFQGWDVDSILILNKEIVKEIKVLSCFKEQITN